MEMPIKIDKIKQTCYACPSQWDMYTVDGQYIYIRYRSGVLSVECAGETIYHKQIGDDLDGYISLEELAVYTHGILDFMQESEELILV